MAGRLAQTSFWEVCDLPSARGHLPRWNRGGGQASNVSALPADAPEIAVYVGVTATDTIGIHSGRWGMDFPPVVRIMAKTAMPHPAPPAGTSRIVVQKRLGTTCFLTNRVHEYRLEVR